MKGSIVGLLAAGLMAPQAAAAQAASCTLADLAFLQGVWRTSDPSSPSEERWTLAPGGRLMGSAWELHPDKPGGVIEAEVITEDAGVVTLRLRHFSSTLAQAREDKDAPMTFVAGRCAPSEVVFDGQGSQAGERMTYRRSGGSMIFVGDFLHQGQPVRVTVEFHRAGR